MKLCILYGNCQISDYIYRILKGESSFASEYEIIPYVNHDRSNYITLKNIDENHLRECDLFIYQPLGENHGVYSTSNILKYLKEECIALSLPYIYNSAMYTVYFEQATERWSVTSLINTGWREIMKLILDEKSENEVMELYDSHSLNFYFEERFKECISNLQNRELECDIAVSDFILSNFEKKRLFLTQNHLTRFFYVEIVNSIFKKLGMEVLLPSHPESDDHIIEAECVIDSYNSSHYNFGFRHSIKNEETKNKIKKFYTFFVENLARFQNEKLLHSQISSDPEIFIN